jgi:hypothetical protein
MHSSTLYRLAGQAGIATGVLLLFNDARRVDLVPENAFTHEIAPLAGLTAPFVLMGLYFWQRRRVGALGLAGFALNLAGIVGVTAVEFTLHYIFPLLDKDTVDRLVDHRTGTGFLTISVLYLAGTILFGLAMWRANQLPRPAALLYVVGLVPTALRNILPAPVVSVAFVVGSAAIIWLAAALIQTVRALPPAESPEWTPAPEPRPAQGLPPR